MNQPDKLTAALLLKVLPDQCFKHLTLFIFLEKLVGTAYHSVSFWTRYFTSKIVKHFVPEDVFDRTNYQNDCAYQQKSHDKVLTVTKKNRLFATTVPLQDPTQTEYFSLRYSFTRFLMLLNNNFFFRLTGGYVRASVDSLKNCFTDR